MARRGLFLRARARMESRFAFLRNHTLEVTRRRNAFVQSISSLEYHTSILGLVEINHKQSKQSILKSADHDTDDLSAK